MLPYNFKTLKIDRKVNFNFFKNANGNEKFIWHGFPKNSPFFYAIAFSDKKRYYDRLVIGSIKYK